MVYRAPFSKFYVFFFIQRENWHTKGGVDRKEKSLTKPPMMVPISGGAFDLRTRSVTSLVGLVVKASASRAGDPGFESYQ